MNNKNQRHQILQAKNACNLPTLGRPPNRPNAKSKLERQRESRQRAKERRNQLFETNRFLNDNNSTDSTMLITIVEETATLNAKISVKNWAKILEECKPETIVLEKTAKQQPINSTLQENLTPHIEQKSVSSTYNKMLPENHKALKKSTNQENSPLKLAKKSVE
ncbi:hypothetical protein KQX54_004334, partial [Cotesia glomerata]